MDSEEREHWVRLTLQRAADGESLIRPAFCKMLSFLTPNHLKKWIGEGRIPTVMIGRVVYVATSVINDWLVAENMKRFHEMRIVSTERENKNRQVAHPTDDYSYDAMDADADSDIG